MLKMENDNENKIESPKPIQKTEVNKNKSKEKNTSNSADDEKKSEIKRNKSKEKNILNSVELKRKIFGSRRKKEKNKTENYPNSDQNGVKNYRGTKFDAGLNNPATNEVSEFGVAPKAALMVTEPHAEEYNMCHQKRGKAIVFNHEVFDKEETREGTKVDVDRIKRVFGEILKFDVEVHNDLEFIGIMTQIDKLSKDDYTDCDCIAMFILTHGRKGGEVSAKDIYYPADKLWDPFVGDKCATLAGKPKLFFVNACRGKKKDSGIRLFRGRTQTDSSKPMTYKLPNQADFLIANSTVEGFYTYRDVINGTWFIECLCNVIEEYHELKDLMKMLTITQRKVAIDYRSQSDKAEDCELTQIPSITTMLIRDVYFRIKQQNE